MAPDRRDSDTAREVRLEGFGLVLGGGVIVALIAGAFYAGRFVERGAHPPAQGPAAAAEAPVERLGPAVEATTGTNVFDGVGTGDKRLEPARDAVDASAETARRAAEAELPSPATPAASGAFYVQVLALRDRGAAAEILVGLERQGYGARLFSEREGGGLLYKVRVGGYETREQAIAARDALRASGHPGAFVWPQG